MNLVRSRRWKCWLVGIVFQLLTSCTHPPASTGSIDGAMVRILPSTGEVVGMAVDSVTGDPLSHALVIATRVDVPDADSFKVAADYSGVFRMHPLPAGHYRFRILYIGYSPRILDVTLPLPASVILLAALDPEHCERYPDLGQCTPEQTHWAKMETARRILEKWHGDAIAIAPNGSVPNEDSVVAEIHDSLGGDAAGVLIEIIGGPNAYGLKAVAATVYARLGLLPAPLQEILSSSNLRDEESVATASAAFRGLRELETRSVSAARAAYVRRAATLIVTDSAPKGLAGELQNAILGLKVERNLGGVAARELLESDEVQLAMKWLVAHGYEIGR